MRIFWPREHGVVASFLFPQIVALALGGFARGAVCFFVSGSAVLLLHEPWLVVSGRRGQQPAQIHAARLWLAMAGLTALVFGGLALFWALPNSIFAALPLAAAGLAFLWFVRRSRERTLVVELVAVNLVAAFALPVALAGGVDTILAVWIGVTWTIGLSLSTAAARALIVQKRYGLGPVRMAGASALLVFGVMCAASLAWPVPGFVPVAIGVFALVTVVVALVPPQPNQMTRVGLLATAACLISTALILYSVHFDDRTAVSPERNTSVDSRPGAAFSREVFASHPLGARRPYVERLDEWHDSCFFERVPGRRHI